jgi:CheY-like chemotaxis protein
MFWPPFWTAAARAVFPRVMTMTTMMMTNEIVPDERWCPVAYVTMQDTATRAEIVSVLERSGWAVVPQPSGFHLIQAISGVIEGHQTWLRPSMIVIDARSRGCSGVTIAAGLRDLGITIPIVLIAAGDAPPVSSDETLRIVDAASAKSAVAELATLAPPWIPTRGNLPCES